MAQVSLARIAVALLLIVGVGFCVCAGIVPLWIVESPLRILFGWAAHTWVVIPRISINWSGVLLFAMLLPATLLLADSFARWLSLNRGSGTGTWRLKWTVLGLAMVIVMFVAGIGATGVVHQTGWLMSSRERLLTSTATDRIGNLRCKNNLRQIALALQLHARQNNGDRPTDQADFIRIVYSQDVTPEVFVCPLSNEEPFAATQPTDSAKIVELVMQPSSRHVSYQYLAQPVPEPLGERRVSVYESIENHEHGINVLYDDGEVGSIPADLAVSWLESIGALLPSTATPLPPRNRGY